MGRLMAAVRGRIAGWPVLAHQRRAVAAALPPSGSPRFTDGAWSLIGGDGLGWPATERYKVRGLAWHAGRLFASVSGPATDGPKGEVWAWDGERWELQSPPWNPNASFVEHLCSHRDGLYVAERSGIWRLDRGRWESFGQPVSDPGKAGPYAFADWNGRLATSFWGVPGVSIDGTMVADPPGGWGPGARTVYCLHQFQGLLYAGTGTGKFTGPGSCIWRFDGRTWEKIAGGGVRGSWIQSGIPFVLSMCTYADMLIATVSRPPTTPRRATNVWAYDGAEWHPVAPGNMPRLMARSLIMNDAAQYRGSLVVATGDGTHRHAEIWALERDGGWRPVGANSFSAAYGAQKGGYWVYRLCSVDDALFAATAGHRGAARVFRFAPC
jgi:hypothetical protein